MSHRTELRVAWGDTDAGGLIYFPRFFHYVVVGLNDYFAPAADGGHLMDRLRRDGYVLPAVDASASFESPLRSGDLVAVETTITAGETSLAVGFSVTRVENGNGNGKDAPVASGEVTFVLVDGDFDPVRLPDAVRACVRDRGDAVTA